MTLVLPTLLEVEIGFTINLLKSSIWESVLGSAHTGVSSSRDPQNGGCPIAVPFKPKQGYPEKTVSL